MEIKPTARVKTCPGVSTNRISFTINTLPLGLLLDVFGIVLTPTKRQDDEHIEHRILVNVDRMRHTNRVPF